MKAKIKADDGKVSLDNFEPAGPRDRPIDSPRSLKACQLIGVQPSELFLLNEDELVEQLDKESIKASDKKSAYDGYIKEMRHIFEKLAKIRAQLIEEEKERKKPAKKSSSIKAKKDRSIRQYPKNDELEGEDKDQPGDIDAPRPEEPSESAAMNSKQLFATKKKASKHLSKSVRPSKKMLSNFQMTQYLPQGSLQSGTRDSAYKEVSPIEKMAKVVAREQRRQQTLLQSYQQTENKRQMLLQKMNDDLRRQQYYKGLKEEERIQRILEGMQRQSVINEKLKYNKLVKMAEQEEIDRQRRTKEERAEQLLRLNQLLKQAKFHRQEDDWAQKRNYITNLKDIEEFNRGVTSAILENKDQKFRSWQEEKESIRQQQLMITQRIENERLEIVAGFEKMKREKERENMLLAEQIKSGKVNPYEVQHVGDMPRRSITHSRASETSKKKKGKKQMNKTQYSEKELAKIIEEFNAKVESEVETIVEEQAKAIEQLEEDSQGKTDKEREKIQQQIALIQQKTQETIDEIRKNQENDIIQLLKSQGIEVPN